MKDISGVLWMTGAKSNPLFHTCDFRLLQSNVLLNARICLKEQRD